jgi:hypothetical protein
LENIAIRKYSFKVGDIIKASFSYTNGFKITAWKMVVIYSAAMYGLYVIFGLLLPAADMHTSQFTYNSILIGLLSIPIVAPLSAGLYMGMISHVRGETVSYKTMFKYYPMVKKLALASLFIHFINNAIFLCADMIGIKWLIALSYFVTICIGLIYIFTLPLIADKGLGVWDAMELSRKVAMGNFFKIFFVFAALTCIMIVGAIPLGIGLIWTIPMMYISEGLLYHMLFDKDGALCTTTNSNTD